MALGDDIKAANQELVNLDDQIKSIGVKLKQGISDQMEILNESTEKVANLFKNDLTKHQNKYAKFFVKILVNKKKFKEKFLKVKMLVGTLRRK